MPVASFQGYQDGPGMRLFIIVYYVPGAVCFRKSRVLFLLSRSKQSLREERFVANSNSLESDDHEYQ